MQSFTQPVFASANCESQYNNAPTTSWGGSDNGADGFDFDLLAEYLLDDGSAPSAYTGNMPTFDFNIDPGLTSGVVSPEQSDDGMPMISPEGQLAPGSYQTTQLLAPSQSAYYQPSYAPQAQQPMQPPATLGHTALLALPAYQPTDMHTPIMPPVASTAAVAAAVAGNKRRRVDAPVMPPRAPASLVNQGHAMAMAVRGRQKSQAQVDRRRERNRILARRTRLRKKFFFEGLQKEVTDLQLENAALKEIAKNELPEEQSKQLLEDCKAMDNLPEGIAEACNEGLDLDSQDFSLVRSIQRSQRCFIITDPSLQDNPIVYASDDFLSLTEYKREEVLGRNCRFLQGTETSTHKLEEVRKAIANGEDVSVTMINYTANGTAFWNKLFIAALRDAHNNIVNFIGVIVKVAHPDPEDPESGKRLPGEQSTGSDEDDDGDFDDAAMGFDSHDM